MVTEFVLNDASRVCRVDASSCRWIEIDGLGGGAIERVTRTTHIHVRYDGGVKQGFGWDFCFDEVTNLVCAEIRVALCKTRVRVGPYRINNAGGRCGAESRLCATCCRVVGGDVGTVKPRCIQNESRRTHPVRVRTCYFPDTSFKIDGFSD